MIKRVMLKQCETKHKKFALENQTLRHNSTYGIETLPKLAVGNGENQRIGDEVVGKYIKCKFMFFNKNDRPNCTYRVIAYRAPAGETSYSDIWENEIGNKIMDGVNTEKYTPIIQKFVKITSNTVLGPDDLVGNYDWTLKENSKYLSFTIPLKDVKIKYQDTSEQPKYQRDNIKLAIVAYDAYGTLTSDDIGTFAFSAKYYYKDP